MWTDNLRQFHFWCQKTLPLVYDDSLSYYEVLAKVTRHLNELTTLVNEIGDELERYEGVTDERLDALETWKSTIDIWKTEIDSWKAIVDTWRENVDEWKESIDLWKTSIENWQTSINSWKDIVDNTLEIIDERLDTTESDINNIETVLNSEYTYLGTVNYNSTDDRVYITLNTSTSCDKLQTLVDFEVKSDIARLTHKPVFYLTFSSDVIAHFENESYPVDSRVYFQDLNADVFSYMKQGSNDIILDGLAIVMSDYNTLKTVKSGVTYRAFYIGNGLYYSFENVGVDIENRLIGAENDIVDLDGRLDTAEDDIDSLENDLDSVKGQIYGETRVISANVDYIPTFQSYCILLSSYDANYIKKYITAAKIPGSAFGHRVKFLLYFSTNSYDYTDLYLLDENSNKIQYNSVDAYINISHPTGSPTIDIYTGCTYMLDTRWTTAIPFVMNGEYDLPKAQPADSGKVVSYNAATKRYELITPSGGLSTHNYSTTEQTIGTWIDGKTMYEKTLVLTTQSASDEINTGLTDIDFVTPYSIVGVSGGVMYPLPYSSTSFTATIGYWLSISNNELVLSYRAGTVAPANMTIYLVVRYTKNTV